MARCRRYAYKAAIFARTRADKRAKLYAASNRHERSRWALVGEESISLSKLANPLVLSASPACWHIPSNDTDSYSIVEGRSTKPFLFYFLILTELSSALNTLFFIDFNQPMSLAHSLSMSLNNSMACWSLSSSKLINAFCKRKSVHSPRRTWPKTTRSRNRRVIRYCLTHLKLTYTDSLTRDFDYQSNLRN